MHHLSKFLPVKLLSYTMKPLICKLLHFVVINRQSVNSCVFLHIHSSKPVNTYKLLEPVKRCTSVMLALLAYMCDVDLVSYSIESLDNRISAMLSSSIPARVICLLWSLPGVFYQISVISFAQPIQCSVCYPSLSVIRWNSIRLMAHTQSSIFNK